MLPVTFVKQMKERGLTLALAESVTCGLAAHMLSGTKGTSDVLKGSLVCYVPEVKTSLMHIPKKMIERYSCESLPVTIKLAKNIRRHIKADVYAAVTGLASPGGSESKNKPVGTVFFCVIYKNKVYRLRKLFKGTPLKIRKKSCRSLYEFIISVIQKFNEESFYRHFYRCPADRLQFVTRASSERGEDRQIL
jgi:nicotinamide-nucleotide amidase